MKISCQSCQSKYNVADDKVQGKIVKIRCRKCGATIVVNATSGVAANGSVSAPPPGPSGAGGAPEGEWHVSVSDNDQRTMTLAQLVEAYNTGVVAQDTFIWTEGMGDWKALAEVDTVVSALHAAAAQGGGSSAVAEQVPQMSAPVAAAVPAYEAAAAPAYEAPAARAYEAPAARAYEAPAASAYEAPAARAYEAPAARAYEAPAAPQAFARPQTGGAFAVQGAAAAAAPVEARRANVVRRDSSRARDLFATRAGEDLQASPTANADDDSRLTGQRNENSVLFSLDVLTKSSEQHAPPVGGGGSLGSKDDSGLIDLKALAAKAESMRPPTMHEIAAPPPLGGVASPLGFSAPLGGFATGAEAQPKSRLPLLIGGGAGVALLLVLGIVIGLKIGGAATPAAMPSASAFVLPPLPSATETPSASASATAAASASASAAPVATKPRAYGGGAWKPGAAGGGGAKPAGAGGAGAGAAGGAGASTTGGGAATGGGGGGGGAAPPKKGDCGCNGDLMCLMRCSTH